MVETRRTNASKHPALEAFSSENSGTKKRKTKAEVEKDRADKAASQHAQQVARQELDAQLEDLEDQLEAAGTALTLPAVRDETVVQGTPQGITRHVLPVTRNSLVFDGAARSSKQQPAALLKPPSTAKPKPSVSLHS